MSGPLEHHRRGPETLVQMGPAAHDTAHLSVDRVWTVNKSDDRYIILQFVLDKISEFLGAENTQKKQPPTVDYQ